MCGFSLVKSGQQLQNRHQDGSNKLQEAVEQRLLSSHYSCLQADFDRPNAEQKDPLTPNALIDRLTFGRAPVNTTRQNVAF